MTTSHAGAISPEDRRKAPADAGAPSDRGAWLAWGTIAVLGVIHGGMVWIVLGGRAGMTSGWPPLVADHGIHYHQALATRPCLATTGTTAGYDPSFLAGYPMSIVSDLSSTLPNVALFLAGPVEPALAYKALVLFAAAAIPWLWVGAAAVWRVPRSAIVAGLVLFEVYFWGDFAFGYAVMGMVGYLLSVPLGLLTVAVVTAYLSRGGFGRWLVAASACAAVFLVHITSAMLVGPAAALAYGMAVVRSRREGESFPLSRHLGFWAIGPVVLAANAFWWVPGLLLAATKAGSENAFAHPEPVGRRLWEILWKSREIQTVLLALGLIGLALRARRDAVATAGLAGFLAAGFFWGYLAGAFRGLDPLQPGRHTYALFTAASVAAGIALGDVLGRLRSDQGPRLDRWLAVALVVIGFRVFGPILEVMHRIRAGGPEPALSSRPPARLLWLVDLLKKNVKPGERLLFEESGVEIPGLTDPFAGRHYSPILPSLTGVEVLGGPYLHMTVTANFTQFGEEKLFGKSGWGRDEFVRYAKLYRPSAIACWTPRARDFCGANPDLVKVVADDGVLLVGRVLGFEGATIRGKAEVTAGPNRIEVRDAVAGDEGLVVLRYHAVPLLASDPPVAVEPVYLEDDPVPFLAFRPNGGTVVFRMRPAPWSK